MKKLKKPTKTKLSRQTFNAFFRLFSGVLCIENLCSKGQPLWSLDHAGQLRAAIGRFASGTRNGPANGPARKHAQAPCGLESRGLWHGRLAPSWVAGKWLLQGRRGMPEQAFQARDRGAAHLLRPEESDCR
ncbi:hypothetical protein [Pseudomonas chlororaphis]|uniref:hypothetical protein n=1 Tax=Pseudomonas chlororaphis TaxID=587753 RepID=UPI002407FF72|nr:hypothetical protein [Pseudomonas chlororaphis]